MERRARNMEPGRRSEGVVQTEASSGMFAAAASTNQKTSFTKQTRDGHVLPARLPALSVHVAGGPEGKPKKSLPRDECVRASLAYFSVFCTEPPLRCL